MGRGLAQFSLSLAVLVVIGLSAVPVFAAPGFDGAGSATPFSPPKTSPTSTPAARPTTSPASSPATGPTGSTKVGGSASKLGFTIPCKIQLGSQGCTSVQGILNRIVAILMSIASTLFFFMFLWGAIQYVSGAGDAGATEAAKKTMLNAAVGLIIVIGAWAIIYFILSSIQTGGGQPASSSTPPTAQTTPSTAGSATTPAPPGPAPTPEDIPAVTATPEGGATTPATPEAPPAPVPGTPEYVPPKATPR